MEKFLQTLEPLVEQGKAKGFVNNVENADKLGSLVEDIRDAVMEYQVYICELTIFDTSDIRTRLRYNKTSTKTVAGS